MRPQRASAKFIDYSMFDNSPALDRTNKRSREDKQEEKQKKPVEVVDKGKKKDKIIKESVIIANKENTDIQPKQKKSKKEQKKEVDVVPLSQSSQPPSQSSQPSSQSPQSSKSKKSKKSKPKPFPTQPKENESEKEVKEEEQEKEKEKPEAYVPLAQQKRALQDPIVAISNIIGDEIKTASSKISTLESDMLLARNAKEFVKSQDHRYESLRNKFDELKATKKVAPTVPEGNTDEELRELIARMREDMKELSHDQTVVRKKLKDQKKEVDAAKKEIEEQSKILEKEKKRVEEEGREINIEKRRIERKDLEKERQDVDREKWVLKEEKKEVDMHKKRNEDEAKELARWRKQMDEEKAEIEKERRRLFEEHSREQRRFEEWTREIEGEKRKIEDQKGYWAYERKEIEKKQEEVVSTLKWQVEKEKRESDKNKMENKQLADELNSATHRWAEHQEKMKAEIHAMVQHINTSERETDTVAFLCMITGLQVNKVGPNKFVCECVSANKQSRLKFEVTIREDVEYTPLEVIGGANMSECVTENIFFSREDWPKFLCKIITSVLR